MRREGRPTRFSPRGICQYVCLDGATEFVQNSARMITHRPVRRLLSFLVLAILTSLSAVTVRADAGCADCPTNSTPVDPPATNILAQPETPETNTPVIWTDPHQPMDRRIKDL